MTSSLKKKKNKLSCSQNKFCSIFLIILCILLFCILLTYIICLQIHEYYSQLDPMLSRIKDDLVLLHEKANHLKFFEGNKSYTINKHKIYLCLKDETNSYYDYNMLIYVAIHELAHVLCNEVGHTTKFYSIFHDLLSKAHNLGIYDSSKPIIKDYCGHN